jgi:hypothetical protein
MARRSLRRKVRYFEPAAQDLRCRRISAASKEKTPAGGPGFSGIGDRAGGCDRSPDIWLTAAGPDRSHPAARYAQIIGSPDVAGCPAGAGLRLEKHGGGRVRLSLRRRIAGCYGGR